MHWARFLAAPLTIVAGLAASGADTAAHPLLSRQETASPANRPPMVRVFCDPCRVAAGHSMTISADAQDPDGDPLTYRWTVPSGIVAVATSRQTTWTAPAEVAPTNATLTVTVTDRRGASTEGTVTIDVVRAVEVTYAFADVLFAANSAALDMAARRGLDEIQAVLDGNPSLRLDLLGQADGEGTAQESARLATRRATAVRDYFVAHGIDGTRLNIVNASRSSAAAAKQGTRRVTIGVRHVSAP